jgi:superfamily II DNA/RNA helicase
MITEGYLCDYNINIPIFTEDPTNRNICEYLIHNYRNTIIYCHSQTEGKNINDIMNNIMPNCSKYIDCNTKKTERNKIIKDYKDGILPFIVNVRVLTEGFDAPITKSVCFLHLPSNQTQIIQVIGRCLRLHPNKKNATVILPASSNDDCNGISRFLKVISNNDSRIKKSYQNKKLGGYISINKCNDTNNEENEMSIQYKYDMIYNSVGLLVNNEEIWYHKLEMVKKFIDENNKRPTSYKIKNKYEKILGKWLSNQVRNSKEREYIMKNNIIYIKWLDFINNEQYKKYFMNKIDKWYYNLSKLIEFIDNNNRRPTDHSLNKDEKYLGRWIQAQIMNSKQRIKNMKDNEIYNIFINFINGNIYKEYFMTDEDRWYFTFEKVKEFIDENKRKPIENGNKKYELKLGRWISDQRTNLKNNIGIVVNNKKIYNEFINFIHNYNEYFMNNKEKWYTYLLKAKEFIDNNQKRPSKRSDENYEKKLGAWIGTQIYQFNKKDRVMKDNDIYNEWNNFINDDKYKNYFL